MTKVEIAVSNGPGGVESIFIFNDTSPPFKFSFLMDLVELKVLSVANFDSAYTK